ALQITSDARYRFERGLDTQSAATGAVAAARMVREMCGAAETQIYATVAAGSAPDHTRTIVLDTALCKKRTGVDVQVAEQVRILKALGFGVTEGAALSVVPPSWRPDIEGAADLVEEVVRVVGYDAVPATSLQRALATTPVALDVEDRRIGQIRRTLAEQGLMESVTWSFMSRELAEKFVPANDALVLQNPISSDLDLMRPTIIANLAQAARRNADRGFADVALFEVGPVFKNTTPEGQSIVATTLRTGQSPRHWAVGARQADVFDAKADAMAALSAAGAPVASLQVTTDAPAWYHPGRSGCLRLGPNVLASFGELHPTLVDAFGLTSAVAVAEIYPANIPQGRGTGSAKPLLKLEPLQPVSRDFAFVVDCDVTAAKLIKAARDADKNLIRDVTVFDVYEGEHVAAGKKSVALTVTLQPVDKTLTDAEIDAIAAKVTAGVTKATGATLRG
ncbi:MAG: phenylalanine--tRNA ligase subunit beta, partial [Alphaproteobacteria bacterium]|nr:phenylalanine--tRNA ligase subunit beta [Alphaproteobacteria bacterium]